MINVNYDKRREWFNEMSNLSQYSYYVNDFHLNWSIASFDRISQFEQKHYWLNNWFERIFVWLDKKFFNIINDNVDVELLVDISIHISLTFRIMMSEIKKFRKQRLKYFVWNSFSWDWVFDFSSISENLFNAFFFENRF